MGWAIWTCWANSNTANSSRGQASNKSACAENTTTKNSSTKLANDATGGPPIDDKKMIMEKVLSHAPCACAAAVGRIPTSATMPTIPTAI